MKKVLTMFLLLALLYSCESASDLKLSEVVPGGCSQGSENAAQGSNTTVNDTVRCTFTINNLAILVGFNATCCTEYSTSSHIKGDSIIINIHSNAPGMCNCLCYYTWNFKFTGAAEDYNYRVDIDDFKTFKGEINSQ